MGVGAGVSRARRAGIGPRARAGGRPLRVSVGGVSNRSEAFRLAGSIVFVFTPAAALSCVPCRAARQCVPHANVCGGRAAVEKGGRAWCVWSGGGQKHQCCATCKRAVEKGVGGGCNHLPRELLRVGGLQLGLGRLARLAPLRIRARPCADDGWHDERMRGEWGVACRGVRWCHGGAWRGA